MNEHNTRSKQAERLCWIMQAMKAVLSRVVADLAGHIQYFMYLSLSIQTLTFSYTTQFQHKTLKITEYVPHTQNFSISIRTMWLCNG